MLESVLPRASSLIELVTPSCKMKSTGFTIPDFEQGTLTTIIRTFFKRSSVGRASRKLSSCKTTSSPFVKVRQDSSFNTTSLNFCFPPRRALKCEMKWGRGSTVALNLLSPPRSLQPICAKKKTSVLRTKFPVSTASRHLTDDIFSPLP